MDQVGGELPLEVNDPLVVFVYLLMRDHIPPGTMEEVTLAADEVRQGNNTVLVENHHLLTNRFLGGYAVNVASRIRADGSGTELPPTAECIVGDGDERRIWLCPVHGLLDPDSLDIDRRCAHCPDQPALRFNIAA